MKKTGFISGIILLITLVSLNISCTDTQEDVVLQEDSFEFMDLKGGVLEEDAPLGDQIFLPKGTSWDYMDDNKSRVKFELPEGYVFLMKNEKTDEYFLSEKGGGYSCTCSSGGSCITFYNSGVGYGCLQNDCKGSCTGKNAGLDPERLIVGVLNSENDWLDSDLNLRKASLSAEGKQGFFEVEEVQQEIKRTYDLIYTYVEKPDFESENYDAEKYVYAKTLLYGFEVGIIIPNDEEFQKLLPELKIKPIAEYSDVPTICVCKGTNQDGDCKLEKKKLLGFVAYYCSGCTTCLMD